MTIAPEVVVLLSGGLDSAACVRFFLDVGRPTSALFIDYQQPAAKPEEEAAKRLADHYGVSLACARWEGPVAKGPGLISGRNAFLLAAALMEVPKSATAVAIGIHAGTEYADCAAEFLGRMQAVYDQYCAGRVQIVAPFLEWSKAEVWSYALATELPFSLTYSCESGKNPPCMRCQSCDDRRMLVA